MQATIIEPGHRPQQGRPDRRLWDPRLRADQPDRRLPAPAAERAAARRRPGDRREAPALIGRKLRLKILEVNRKANRLILSEKVALYEERARSATSCSAASRSARRSPAPSARSPHSASSSTSAASTASSTRVSSRGTRSTTPKPATSGGGEDRVHRRQPRTRPYQPADPAAAARPVALVGG